MKKSILVFSLIYAICTITVFTGSAYGNEVKTVKPDLDLSKIDLSKDGFDFAALLKTALAASPDIKAAGLAWRAGVERIPQAGSLDDPMIGFGYFLENVETRTGPQNGSISISQRIPFPGKLASKSEIAYRDAEISRLKLGLKVKKLIRELRVEYAELVYLDRAIDISRRNIEIADHLVTLGESGYSAGETLLSDTFRAQSQRAQLDYDLLLLAEDREVVTGRINMLLNRDIDLPVGRPIARPFKKVPLELKELYRLTLQNQEQMVIAGVRVERSDNRLTLAKLTRMPDFKAGISYISVGERPVAADSGKDALLATLTVSVPLWQGRNRATIEEAKAKRAEAVQLQSSVKNSLLAEVKEVYFRIRNLERLVTLYDGSLIPQAYEAMRLAETWYKEENGSFGGMLEAEAVWLRFNLQRERAVGDYLKKLARLEELTGSLKTGAKPERGEK